MNAWPRDANDDLKKFYGDPGTDLTFLTLPYPLIVAWDLSKTVRRLTCHRLVHDSLGRIFSETLATYGQAEISRLRLDLFGGCYNKRLIRGGTRWSTHAFGAAVDIDPDNNLLRWGSDKATLAKADYEPFWEIVEAEGWISLGRSKNYDWMHFQATLWTASPWQALPNATRQSVQAAAGEVMIHTRNGAGIAPAQGVDRRKAACPSKTRNELTGD